MNRSKFVGSIFIILSLISPVAAHTIKTGKDVGVTFHIEPDHNPRAGEAATAWFALTYEGGTSIPLAQCDCRVAVYERSSQQQSPILQPPLKPISVEQYQQIPGTEIVFPKAGIYAIEISGSPKAGAEFEPFQLSYNVTVLTGKTPADEATSATESLPQAQSSDSSHRRWRSIGALSAIALGIAVGFWVIKK